MIKLGGNYKHAMLDLESLSVRNDACIIQIGLVPFDLLTGKISDKTFLMNVSRQDCERYGLHVMAETVEWWSQQDPAVWESTQCNPRSLFDTLDTFSTFWTHNMEPNARVWSHSVFDIPVIETAFHRVGLQVPWNFKQPMDIRTLEWLAETRKSHYPDLANDFHHNALSDCFQQIDYVCRIYRKLKDK